MAPHILIIEPDTSAAQITRAGVKRALPEATLVVEPTPERGRLSIQDRCPDLLIIDPPVHSLTTGRLIHDLKQACPEAQVIVLASAPTPTLRRQLQRLGADAYLAKPVTMPALMETIQRAEETIRHYRATTVLPGSAPG
jgi:DNA-binding NarL/FixJ family response regulator